MEQEYSFEQIENIANDLKSRVSIEPRIGIICGSELGSIADVITNPTTIDYSSIPNFPSSTTIGQAGRLIFGHISTIPIICMQGRFHYVEGYSLSKCTMSIRVMKLLGVHTMIISNAAGGINSNYSAGDIMLIKDHINFVGFSGGSPLKGSNLENFGPRFVALNNAYDDKFLREAKILAQRLGLQGVHEGVYACVGGPACVTLAEVKVLKTLGADAVGMSTVHEVVVARHCGIRCFGFSLINNKAVMDYGSEDKPDGEEALAVDAQKENLKYLVKHLLPILDKTHCS